MLQFSNLTVSRANIKKVANFVLKCWWQNKSLLAAPLIGIMYPWLAKADEMLRKDRCAFTIQSVFLFKTWTFFYLPVIWPQRHQISHLSLNSTYSFTFFHYIFAQNEKKKQWKSVLFPGVCDPNCKIGNYRIFRVRTLHHILLLLQKKLRKPTMARSNGKSLYE